MARKNYSRRPDILYTNVDYRWICHQIFHQMLTQSTVWCTQR